MKMIKHNIPRYRGDFITAMDSLFDRMLKNEFPNHDRGLGSDFFVKGSYPKVNVYQDSDKLFIEAAIPGLSKDDITLTIKDNTLSISGKSDGTGQSKEKNRYFIRELKKSSFTRSFLLSDDLDKDTVTAKVKDGLLLLSIEWKQPKSKDLDSMRVIDIE